MRETRNGVKVSGAVQPLDRALKEAIKAPEVRLCLQPLQGGAKRKHEAAEETAAKKGKEAKDYERMQKTIENLQNQVKNLKGAKGGKGKGQQGKGKTRMIRLPPQLIGVSPTDESSEPMCYDFNLKAAARRRLVANAPKDGASVCARTAASRIRRKTTSEVPVLRSLVKTVLTTRSFMN